VDFLLAKCQLLFESIRENLEELLHSTAIGHEKLIYSKLIKQQSFQRRWLKMFERDI